MINEIVDKYITEGRKFHRGINDLSRAIDKLKELKVSYDFYSRKNEKGSIIYFYDKDNKEVAYYAEPTSTLTVE